MRPGLSGKFSLRNVSAITTCFFHEMSFSFKKILILSQEKCNKVYKSDISIKNDFPIYNVLKLKHTQ